MGRDGLHDSASRAKLRQLQKWVREFRRYFSVNGGRRIVCRISDLTTDHRGSCCERKGAEYYGASWVGAKAKGGYILLDPSAWDSTLGPYKIALHEFLHVLMRFKACDNHEASAEEEAIEHLTKLYTPLVANKERFREPA